MKNSSYLTITELSNQKLAGSEKVVLEDANVVFHQQEYERLRCELEQSYQNTCLRDTPSTKEALNDLLVQLKMQSL